VNGHPIHAELVAQLAEPMREKRLVHLHVMHRLPLVSFTQPASRDEMAESLEAANEQPARIREGIGTCSNRMFLAGG
jgi:hypothetical protein